MSQVPAGWHNDPYGRYQQRYWDGQQWTAHVATNGQQTTDPLGNTAVIPFAIPSTAYTTPEQAGQTQGFAALADPDDPTSAADPGDVAGGHGITFLDRMAPESRLRSRPRLQLVLAGVGGAVAAFGLAALVVGDNGSTRKWLLCGIIAVAVGLVVRLVLSRQHELRAASVGLGAAGIAMIVGSIASDHADKTWPWFLAAGLYLAAWVLPGFHGRPVMLGLGTFALVIGIGGLFASDTTCPAGFSDGVCADSSSLSLPAPVRAVVGDQKYVFLVVAALLFALVWWLDRRGYHGTATPLIVSALGSAWVGTGLAASDLGDTAAAALVLAVGVVVCYVGSHGGRRATTWWGAVLTAVGVIALWATTVKPTTTKSIGVTALAAAACLIVIPAVGARLVGNDRDREPR